MVASRLVHRGSHQRRVRRCRFQPSWSSCWRARGRSRVMSTPASARAEGVCCEASRRRQLSYCNEYWECESASVGHTVAYNWSRGGEGGGRERAHRTMATNCDMVSSCGTRNLLLSSCPSDRSFAYRSTITYSFVRVQYFTRTLNSVR